MKCLNEESMVFDTMLSLSLSAYGGRGQGEQGRADPTRHPDPTPRPPTRHPDPTRRPPDPKRQVRGMQADASGCKGGKADARGCKGMQAIKQGGRGKGVGARGKGVANLAKRRKRKKPWRFQRGVFISRGVMRQGSFALLARLLPLAPLTPPPSPLPPCFSGCIPFAFPSHYGFSSPSHSARIPLSYPSPAFTGRGVGGSGRGVGSGVGVSGRGVGSGRLCPAPPAPCPHRRSETAPFPPLPPLPVGRGGVKFAPPSLSLGGRLSILRPTQSVRSYQIV